MCWWTGTRYTSSDRYRELEEAFILVITNATTTWPVSSDTKSLHENPLHPPSLFIDPRSLHAVREEMLATKGEPSRFPETWLSMIIDFQRNYRPCLSRLPSVRGLATVFFFFFLFSPQTITIHVIKNKLIRFRDRILMQFYLNPPFPTRVPIILLTRFAFEYFFSFLLRDYQ